MFSDKKKIFETSFLFRGLSFYGAGCKKLEESGLGQNQAEGWRS
jgi:hypothetical protein